MANGIGRGRGCGVGRMAGVVGLVLLPALAAAQGGAARPNGRGFVWGAALGGGQLSFGGAEGLALALGPVEEQRTYTTWGSTTTQDVRSAWVVRAGDGTAGAEHVVPFASGAAGGFWMHGGYAFDRRLAVLVDVGVCAGGDSSGFNQVVGGFVVRYWPHSRLWLQTGPAFGDLGYGHGSSVVRAGTMTGRGWSGMLGVSVLRQARWSLDVETRFSQVAYEGGLHTRTLTLQLGASRLPAIASGR